MSNPSGVPRTGRPAGPAPRTSVLLVDDHELVREGIRNVLSQDPGIAIVGEAKDGREAVARAKALDPDVILMDIGMPRMNGIEATRRIAKVAPRSRVLILSAHSDDHYIAGVTAMGAVGYILKQSSLAELSRAIRKTAKGGTYVAPAVRKRMLEPAPGSGTASTPPTMRVPHLSSREAEVLQYIAEGLANKQTALQLGISIKTVEKHRQRLMSKLDIHDVAGLTRYAMAAGVIDVRAAHETD